MSDIVMAESLEDGAILALTLNQPKANIVTGGMLNALSEALSAHQDDKDLKLVTLRGAGSHFSFGASIEEHRKDEAPAMLETLHRVVRQMVTYPVPIAALVDGRCLGGGFELVLCCHFVFATQRALFSCPEIKLAVFPPVLSVLGPIRLGPNTSERLVLTGANLTAAEGKAISFCTEVVEDGAGLEAAVMAWYGENLKPLSAFAIRQGTKAARRASGLAAAVGDLLDAAEKQYVAEVLSSHDGNEGIESFIAKRPPVWENV